MILDFRHSAIKKHSQCIFNNSCCITHLILGISTGREIMNLIIVNFFAENVVISIVTEEMCQIIYSLYLEREKKINEGISFNNFDTEVGHYRTKNVPMFTKYRNNLEV